LSLRVVRVVVAVSITAAAVERAGSAQERDLVLPQEQTIQ
jgi:hypothetical protein